MFGPGWSSVDSVPRPIRGLYMTKAECIILCVFILGNTAKVVIDVQDENDNPPVFTRPLYICGVTEDAKTFTPILQVQVQSQSFLSC